MRYLPHMRKLVALNLYVQLFCGSISVNVRAQLLRKNYSRNFSSMRSGPFLRFIYVTTLCVEVTRGTRKFRRRVRFYFYFLGITLINKIGHYRLTTLAGRCDQPLSIPLFSLVVIFHLEGRAWTPFLPLLTRAWK